jgi:hypothetical protein
LNQRCLGYPYCGAVVVVSFEFDEFIVVVDSLLFDEFVVLD